MPISHTCPTCLTELARVRALPDPHYGLPVVVCPGCGRAVVRTKHPDRVFWRHKRLLLAGLWSVVWRLGLMVLAGLLMSLSVLATGYGLPEWLNGEHPMQESDRAAGEASLFIGMLFLFIVLAGLITRLVVLTRLFWRAAVLLLVVAFAWIMNFEIAEHLATIDYANMIHTSGSSERPLAADHMILMLALLFAAMLLSWFGWVLGGLVKRVSRWLGGSPLRRQLKRARKRRVRLAGG